MTSVNASTVEELVELLTTAAVSRQRTGSSNMTSWSSRGVGFYFQCAVVAIAQLPGPGGESGISECSSYIGQKPPRSSRQSQVHPRKLAVFCSRSHCSCRNGSQWSHPIRHGRRQTAPEARAGIQSKPAGFHQLSLSVGGSLGQAWQRSPYCTNAWILHLLGSDV